MYKKGINVKLYKLSNMFKLYSDEKKLEKDKNIIRHTLNECQSAKEKKN